MNEERKNRHRWRARSRYSKCFSKSIRI